MSERNAAELDALARLAVKEHVSLGGLGAAERVRALTLVWLGLPAGVRPEREVNEALKSQLQATAAFLGTDHVELRRWLVDTGFVTRDGFGREYRRVEASELPADAVPTAAALLGIDPASFVAAERRAAAERRQAGRERWQARQRAGAA